MLHILPANVLTSENSSGGVKIDLRWACLSCNVFAVLG